jgi:capsular exopolysaccharide synthesis family protein
MSTESQSEGIDLQQYLMTLKRQWLPAAGVFWTTVLICVVATLIQKPIYEGTGKLLLKVDPLSRLTGVISPDSEPTVAADSVNTEVEVIQSTPLIQSTISALDLVDDSGKPLTPRKFRKGLKVKSVRGTTTISISYRARSAEESATVVNKLIELYLERNRLSNRAEATAAREFIEKQLPETQLRVAQASEALTKFKQQNRFVSADDEAKAYATTLQRLEEDLNQAQSSLANSRARSASLQRQLNTDPRSAIALSTLSQSQGVQKALEELQDIQSQLTRARARFQEEAPVIISLKEKEARIRQLLQQRIREVIGDQSNPEPGKIQLGKLREDLVQDLIKSEVDRSGYENQFSTITNQYRIYRQRSTILAGLEQTQRELLLNLNAAQSTYETLLKRLQEIRLAENQNVGNAQVIEPALPPERPDSPKKALNLVVGVAIGLVLGVLTAFILDYRDNTLKTSRDAKEIFGYPLLGIIPAFVKRNMLLYRTGSLNSYELSVRDDPHSYISETYRMVFANLQLAHIDKGLKVVVVTSSVAGEGKSTLAANLALASAGACYRTLLIDADLRRASQHRIWNLPNGEGLSDVLSRNVEPETVIQQIEGIDVLLSGQSCSNPLTLLNSLHMKDLIQTISNAYDVVIIDSPPLLVSADASVLGKKADGILLVVRPEILARQNAIRAQELLLQSDQKILGQVVNSSSASIEADSQLYYNQDYYKNGLMSVEKLKQTKC